MIISLIPTTMLLLASTYAFPNGLFFQDLGILIEPTHFIGVSSGKELLPIIVKLPDFKPTIESKSCFVGGDFRKYLTEELLNVFIDMELLAQTLTPNLELQRVINCKINHVYCNNRNKRWVGAAIATVSSLASIGINLWGVRQVETQQENVNNHIKSNIEKLSRLAQKYNSIICVLNKQRNDLIEVQNQLQYVADQLGDVIHCNSENIKLMEVLTKARVLKMMFERALINSLNGQLDPFFMPLDTIDSVISQNYNLADSILAHDKSLFYETAKVMVHYYNMTDKSLHLSVIVPIIKMPDFSFVYRVINMGYMENGHRYKIRTPEFVYNLKFNTKDYLIPIDKDMCDQYNNIWICMSESLTKTGQDSCLSNLFHNNTKNCVVDNKAMSLDNVIIQGTNTGILISGIDNVIYEEILPLDILNSREINLDVNKNYFFSYNNYSNIRVKGYRYSAKKINIHFNVTNIDLPYNKVEIKKTNVFNHSTLDFIKNLDNEIYYNGIKTHYGMINLIIINFLLITIFIICCVIYRRGKDKRRRQKCLKTIRSNIDASKMRMFNMGQND